MSLSSLYPFDPTGTSPTNTVGNPNRETHVVTASVGGNMNYIVPLAAPFFRLGLVVEKIVGNVHTPLVEGVDYMLTHRFLAATQSLGKPVYGSISIINANLAGTVGLKYQTVGGDWTLDDVNIVRQLTNDMYNIRTVSWDQVAGLPYAFPPGPHSQPLEDMKGYEDLLAKMDEIKAAIIANGTDPAGALAQLAAHINSNAGHNKAQVGLALVQNYAMAVSADWPLAVAINKMCSPNDVRNIMPYHRAGSADRLSTSRTIELSGVVIGSVSFDGSGNVVINTSYSTDPTSINWNTLAGRPADLISGALSLTRIPNLPASIISDGELDVLRIPALDASKIVTGVLDLARLPDIPVGRITGAIGIAQGGTGGTTATDARTALGLAYASDTDVNNNSNTTVMTAYRTRLGFQISVSGNKGHIRFPNWLAAFQLCWDTVLVGGGGGNFDFNNPFSSTLGAISVFRGNASGGANSYPIVSGLTNNQISLSTGQDGRAVTQTYLAWGFGV